MATVVNTTELVNRFAKLGWANLGVQEVIDFLAANNIPAAALVAYLDAAVAKPDGFDDQTVQGCSAGNASKITAALRSKGVEVV